MSNENNDSLSEITSLNPNNNSQVITNLVSITPTNDIVSCNLNEGCNVISNNVKFNNPETCVDFCKTLGANATGYNREPSACICYTNAKFVENDCIISDTSNPYVIYKN
jgi:pterin-4a-carbinolamine dehydratase